MAEPSVVSPADSNAHRDDGKHVALEPKHEIFLSHSGAQKLFVEYLCDELERCLRYPFFDLRVHSLPIGENFPDHIFDAIRQCHVGVVILSKDFIKSKWPMMELVAMVKEAKKRVAMVEEAKKRVAMVEEAKKRETFTLIPVFFHISLAEFDDPKNWKIWRECWGELALKNPGRVLVEECVAALKHLRPLNSLVNQGLRESEFLKLIVDSICAIVPAEIRLEDSHMQGRSRICKVIRDEIDLQLESKRNGVRRVGLYAMGGMGKTTVCKALCNDLFTEFRGRVCHAELERVSEEELLRDVLKRLSNTSREHLNGFNLSELQNGLKEGKFIKGAPVFLALDNMSDTNASIMQAKGYLSARLPPESIILVTARSEETLRLLRPFLDENECMRMPELEIEEARSLFVKSSEGQNEDNEELIQRCVERCRFLRDDSETSYHFHPLALDVLGKELARLNGPEEWGAQLDMVDKDIFNQSNDKNHHGVFSILRKSFDTLGLDDQLLFMDVALFSPFELQGRTNVFEWLGMVHRIPSVDGVLKALETLRRKSLLESFGGGNRTSICLHDLWRAFCVAETKSGKLRRRRWVYETEACSDSSPSGSIPDVNRWGNVKRMAFLGYELRSLERVNFAHFSNVTVLKITMPRSEKKLVVDLSELIYLRSLEISGSGLRSLTVQRLPRDLIFLSLGLDEDHIWTDPEYLSQEVLVKQIEGLEGLQCLQLISYGGGKLPNMKSMKSLLKAIFWRCRKVATVTGLSSNLRVLDFGDCKHLRSCPGVGDLVALEELIIKQCWKLKSLPNLGWLRKLRKLIISCSVFITELPGLGDLVALEELNAAGCERLLKLPDMHKLVNLQELNLEYCRSITEMPGFDSLISLREVVADFRAMVDRPNLGQLTRLQKVRINGWSSAAIMRLNSLTMLHSLCIGYYRGVDGLPDLRSLIRLQTLSIEECVFKDVSGLSNLSSLENLRILGCKKLRRLLDLQRLTSLKSLRIEGCAVLRRLDCTLVQPVEGSSCKLEDTSVLLDLPTSQRVTNLGTLTLANCGLADLTSIGAFSQLQTVVIESLPVMELPDLSNFPRLKTLSLRNCENLGRLMSRVPLNALSELEIDGCSSLAVLPDLCNFPGLLEFRLMRYDGISMLSSSVRLTALRALIVKSCTLLTALPDLGMFLALESLKLDGCPELAVFSSSVRLTALTILEVESCTTLTALPDLGMFPALETLELSGCSKLKALSSSVPVTALTWLKVKSCTTLRALPNLGMFPALQTFKLDGCRELAVFSSSVPLTTLTIFEVESCTTLTALPDLGMFPALETLKLDGCPELAVFSSSVPLTALTILEVESCTTLTALPDLRMFPALETLELNGCSKLTALSSSVPVTALTRLKVKSCTMRALPDLGMFPALESLELKRCSKLRALSSSVPLAALTILEVESCTTLTALPDLGMFPALETLVLDGRSKLRALSSSVPLTALTILEVESCTTLTALPDLGMFPALETLELDGWNEFTALSSSVPVTALTWLKVKSCTTLRALPDLGMFPALETLELHRCPALALFSSSVPLTTLTILEVESCTTLTALPDLVMFPALETLKLEGCPELAVFSSSVPLTALQRFKVESCPTLTALPDLGMFPALKRLKLDGCSELRALSSSVPLIALRTLDARGCRSLSGDVLDELRAWCPQCAITYPVVRPEDQDVRPEDQDVGTEDVETEDVRTEDVRTEHEDVRPEEEDVRPEDEDVRPEVEDVRPEVEDVRTEHEDVRAEDKGIEWSWRSRLLRLCRVIVNCVPCM